MSFPFFGEEFTFTQPDETTLQVRGWGDQKAAVFETLDGFTVTKDPVTGFYQYATLAPFGAGFEPTGARPGQVDPRALGIDAGLRLSRTSARAQMDLGVGLPKSWWETRRERAKAARQAAAAGIAFAPPSRPTVGNYVGLCLLVQFPDVVGTIPQGEVSAFCNQSGYGGFGNNGSVYNYFYDNSIGRLRYNTVVAPYYTARYPRAYYTNPAIPYGQRTRELILEALSYHISKGFDFSGLTVDGDGHVFATNVYYAGPRVNNWSQGLWPHASRLMTPFPLAPGINAFDYQITDMGSFLTLGTYCHENGHMLCDFPDLYDYGLPGIQSSGIGSFCLMCAGANVNQKNPTHVNAYLKHLAGWANSVTPLTAGLAATAPAGSNDFFIRTKNPSEYFIVENRNQAGRDVNLPDSGLAIWHVDEFGNNSNEQMTLASHYECSLEQADGLFDLEGGNANGDSKDLFHAGWKDRFGAATSPSSRWWDGSPSGLEIDGVSAAGPRITFRVT